MDDIHKEQNVVVQEYLDKVNRCMVFIECWKVVKQNTTDNKK